MYVLLPPLLLPLPLPIPLPIPLPCPQPCPPPPACTSPPLQLPDLVSGQLQPSPAAWLACLREALPALDLSMDDGLLQGTVQGLAHLCSMVEAGEGGGGESRACLILSSVQHGGGR